MQPDGHSQTLLSRWASVVPLDRHEDNRGVLVPIEFADLPFVPRRAFTISGVPTGTARGGHAHRSGRQFLMCPSGRVRIRLRDRNGEETVVLDRPDQGLLIEPGVWSEQVYELDETVLLVFVSKAYDGASDLDEAGELASG
jgi:UDP-2-acetamido-3-amino-2,3-dideoxy-glucuronate N-acetyltransferase